MTEREKTLFEIGTEIMHQWNAYGAMTVENPEAKTIMRKFMKAMTKQAGKDEAIRQVFRSVERLTEALNTQDILFRVASDQRLPIHDLETNTARALDLAPEYRLVVSYGPHRVEQVLQSLKDDIKSASNRINDADCRPQHKDASLEPLNHALSEIDAEIHTLWEIGK